MEKAREGPSYEVRRVTNRRGTKRDGEFKVSWKGYTKEDDQWTPADWMGDCQEKLRQYEDRRAGRKRGRKNGGVGGDMSGDVREAPRGSPRGVGGHGGASGSGTAAWLDGGELAPEERTRRRVRRGVQAVQGMGSVPTKEEEERKRKGKEVEEPEDDDDENDGNYNP